MARYRAYQAVIELVRGLGRGRGVVLGIDDLHWAEPSTLHLVSHLLHGDVPGLVVVATSRSTEVGVDHPLRINLDRLRKDLPIIEMEVPGLSEPEVAELIRRSSGSEPSGPLTVAVHAGTAGNPLFVREVVRTVNGWEPGQTLPFPESVRSLVRQRVDRLPPVTRDLVEIAAVDHSRIDLTLLSAVVDRPVGEVTDELEPARAAGLLTRAPDGRLGFTHEVTRNAIDRNLSTARRAQLHRRIGEALVAQHRDLEPLLERLAGHFAHAASDGDATRATEFAERAGNRALTLFAYQEAANRFQDGLDALDHAGDDDESARLRLILGRQTANRRAGNTSTELHAALDALALARAIGTPAQIADASVGLSSLGWRDTGSGDIVADALQGALDHVTEDPNADVQVSGELAIVTAVLDRHARSVELCRRIQQRLADVDDDAVFVAATTTTVDLLMNEDPLDRRLAMIDAAQARAERSGSAEARAVVLATRRYLLWEGRDREGAEDAGRAYEVLVDELRMPRYQAGRAQRRAMVALLRGHFDAAEALAEEMLELQPHREFLEGFVAQIFALRAEQGRLGEVLTMIDDLGVGDLVSWRGAKALCLTELGEVRRARDHLRPYWEQAPDLARNALWLAGSSTAAMATAWVDDQEGAARLYELLQPEAERVVIVGTGALCLGMAARTLGPLALLLGDLDAAETWCRTSLAGHDEMRAVPFRVADQLWLAKVLEASGGPARRREAGVLRDQALVDADRLHMGGRLVDEARRRR